MLKQIKSVLQFYSSGLKWELAAIGLGGLMEIGVVFIVTMFGSGKGEYSYIMVGSLLAYFMFLLIAVCGGESFVCGQFNIMVSMGRTRKEFYISCYAALLVHAVIGFLAVLLIMFVERGISNYVYRGWQCALDFGSILLDYRMMLGTVLLVPVCALFFGALFLRFHTSVLWLFWGGGCLLMSLSRQTETVKRCMDAVAAVWNGAGGVLQTACVAILTAILTAGSVFLYSRQRVTG